MPGLASSTGVAPALRSSLTETPAGPFMMMILPLPPSCSTIHSAASWPHMFGIGVDLGGDLVGVDQAVEIDDGDALVAGLGDHAVERGRRAGDHDDGVDIGVDHRLDLLDLRVGVALGVGDHELVDEALLLELVDDVLDRALGLLHPGRDRVDVGPADGVGRLAVAGDALGHGHGRAAGSQLKAHHGKCRDAGRKHCSGCGRHSFLPPGWQRLRPCTAVMLGLRTIACRSGRPAAHSRRRGGAGRPQPDRP